MPADYVPGSNSIELNDEVAFQNLFVDYANEDFTPATDNIVNKITAHAQCIQ